MIRSNIQNLREKLPKEEQLIRSRNICQMILNSGILNDAKHIAIYLPVRGEADPTFLQHFQELSEKIFYLPVLSEEHKNHLEFARYDENTIMKLNRFKIPEPDTNSTEVITDPKQLDAVIMPMVAIDNSGNRIGMGGGFYDRTYAFRKKQACKPDLIAFAYNFQLIERQTPQAWDVPADAIALENKYFRV